MMFERIKLQGIGRGIYYTIADWVAGFWQFRYRCRICDRLDAPYGTWFCRKCFEGASVTECEWWNEIVDGYDMESKQLQAEIERLTEALFKIRRLTMRRDGLEQVARLACDAVLNYDEPQQPTKAAKPTEDE